MDDFIDLYLRYTEETEPPYIYHRWCAIATIGALLGRNFYFQHGHFRVFPNLFCMLIGEPGARKSTSIKLIKKLLVESGYYLFAAEKTSKEAFLLDLQGRTEDENSNEKGHAYDKITAQDLWGDSEQNKEPREVFIAADEFKEFIGINNSDFCTTLGNLWDWDSEYKPFDSRLKNSRSVAIWQPTLSILGGITQELYAEAFPVGIIGGGFLSRMLHIHGEKSDRKYTFPPVPKKEDTDRIVAHLKRIRQIATGAADKTPEALEMLDKIYNGWKEIDDPRFKSYSTRRFNQLLKLCLIKSASWGTNTVDAETVRWSNTILSAAETNMPKALGEFGKSKNSDVANKVMEVLTKAVKPLSIKEIWEYVYKDLEKITMLADIIQGLNHAGKIQHVEKKGWLPFKIAVKQQQYVDLSLLTEEERKML